jgi:hypothetical protein
MFDIETNIILFHFFEQKKNIEQKTFVKKTWVSQNMRILGHMSIFPKAHGTYVYGKIVFCLKMCMFCDPQVFLTNFILQNRGTK